jgi:catechol 2,3-dioxygenase-like lactoylglutathione lyase family enzyme
MNRPSLGTNVVCQVGLVVRDIERTARAYAEIFGLEVPPVRVTGTADRTQVRYRGKTTPGRAKLAFFQMGQVSIELIEPIDGPSTWREFLDAHGEGVHHLAFRVKGMDQALAFLNARGIPAVQRGEFRGGRYAYVDSAPALKVLLELLESDGK